MANVPSDRALRVVLVGATGPLGVEVKARLQRGRRPFGEVVLAEVEFLDAEGARLLDEFAGEALLIADAREVDYAGFDLAILLGPAEAMSPLLEPACRARACIDASGASRRRPDIVWAHAGIHKSAAIPTRGLVAAPHPVACTLAQLLFPLTAAELLHHASATVLLPAAALGAKAVEELHQQTVAVMSFQELPREHLPGQLAFNIIPPGGAGSDDLGRDLSMEVAGLLGSGPEPGGVPCDVQLLLVPSFYGYAYSVHVSLTKPITSAGLRKKLTVDGVRFAARDAHPRRALESPEILVGSVQEASPGSHWIWAVADSLGAGAAENVVQVFDHLAGGLQAMREGSA